MFIFSLSKYIPKNPIGYHWIVAISIFRNSFSSKRYNAFYFFDNILDNNDRVYPIAASRLGPRFQANVTDLGENGTQNPESPSTPKSIKTRPKSTRIDIDKGD